MSTRLDRASISDTTTREGGGLVGYVLGFGLSLMLTLGAYLVVQTHLRTGHVTPSDSALLYILCALALTQFVVQMLYFLHVGRRGSGAAQSRLALFFMIVVVAVIVIGSLWIMHNLNYHMSSDDVTNYMFKQDGL